MDFNRRKFFRLTYPESYRPKIKIYGDIYFVSQVSERGIVLLIPDLPHRKKGAKFVALIEFADKTTLKIGGRILRIEGDKVIGELSESIDFKRINEEQRQLKLKFPAYKPT